MVMLDLTVVEEVDTQVELDDAPGTPARTSLENASLFRSPGAASEMSGTTAITSFSMVEAEFLEPKYVLKHLHKLCDSAQEFLEHLAPAHGTMEDDYRNIQEILKPDSDYTEEYRDFNDELNVHLKHYKSEEHSYIHVRAVHRALFDGSGAAATGSGLDLILYLGNILIFAKQMIHSERHEKEMWDALRQLDNSFPSQFMHSLEEGIELTTAGESATLKQTLDLALELRTQLAILVLERSSTGSNFDPDEVIQDVFYRSEPSQGTNASIIRGWNIAALGGEDSALPIQFERSVVDRINIIRAFFPLDDEALERGDVVDLEGLGNNFPWEATILRLLEWIRCRHKELSTTINEVGGATAILRNVKEHIENPQITIEQPRVEPQAMSPRRKRTSFGRERRRSSRKFDPNAPVDFQAIDLLKARERLSEPSTVPQTQEEAPFQPSVEEEVEEQLPVTQIQDDDHQPIVGEDDIEGPDEQMDATVEERSQSRDAEDEPDPELRLPPTSSIGILKAVRAMDRREKENRNVSIFDPQSEGERVDFGDGFDTQPSPGPSARDKGKQRSQPSAGRKRTRPVEVESESDGEAFETADRAGRVHERRQKAPVTKKVRIDPSSSAAPTSHQPQRRHEVVQEEAPRPEQNESISETDAPDMTEEAPPSTYQAQRRLAKQNIAMPAMAPRTDRKPRTDWTPQEEDAFAEYMGMFPAKYSAILRHDQDEGYNVLQERTQVNLKDKARNMAINMIK